MSDKADLSQKEEDQADEHENVPPSVIFEAIRREAKHELSRPFSALWWSGVAAGLAISVSVVCKGSLASILAGEAVEAATPAPPASVRSCARPSVVPRKLNQTGAVTSISSFKRIRPERRVGDLVRSAHTLAVIPTQHVPLGNLADANPRPHRVEKGTK